MDFKIVPYENRGMLNSEIYAVVKMAREKDCRVIESGTARGHSTETIAINGVDIVSIDNNTGSDLQYAKKKLSKYDNVQLIHGDSVKIIWNYLTEPCIVLIDGPKGRKAIDFAKKLLDNDNVLMACIHDLYAPSMERDCAEGVLGGWFTDDPTFVEEHRHLDAQCWQWLKDNNGVPEKPYCRRGKKIDSYASTLGVFT